MKIKSFAILFLILIILITTSCRPKPITPLNYDDIDTDLILKRLKGHSQNLRTLKALGHISIKHTELNQTLRLALIYKQYEQFRLDTFIIFIKAMSLSIIDDKFSLYIPEENGYVKDSDNGEEILADMGLPISLEIFKGMVNLDLNLPDKWDTDNILLLAKDGEDYIIRWQEENIIREILIKGKYYYPLKLIQYSPQNEKSERIIWELKFSHYNKINEVWRPNVIVLEYLEEDSKVQITYEKQIINNEIDDKKFIIEIPEDALPLYFEL